MGCTVREKHVRTNRRPRSSKPDFDYCCHFDRASISKSIIESGLKPFNHRVGSNNDSTQSPKSAPIPNSNFDETGWGYCTEEQLEEILLKNLEFLYSEATSKLVALGYGEDSALKAVLRNGHCYGDMDVLTNILHNSLAYLNTSCGGSTNGKSDESEPVFADLRQIEEYSLAGMVCMLQQVRPHLSKGDAMWCLLMSDLHVGRASTIEIPVLPGGGNENNCPESGIVDSGSNGNHPVGVMAPARCRFHGGWGFGNGGDSEFPVHGFFSYGPELTLQKDIECPKRFNLSPSMKSLLKRNVAMFAAGFRANSKQLYAQPQPSLRNLTSEDAPVVLVSEVEVQKSEDSRNLKNQEGVNSVLNKFRYLNLDENLNVGHDQKNEVIVTLLHQVKELEKQVEERKQWAHQKAMQAATKLSHDLAELKMLRLEREETQKLKKGKQSLEDTTMKRLSEMENCLRKASGQVDRANASVRRLEAENAEIRAEMEASKLSTSESVNTCLEIAKREKKFLKRLVAWERTKAKLQEEIAVEKEKISELQQHLARMKNDQKEAEVKWRQELKANEAALLLVEEERRAKEAAEACNKRKLEALRLKIEIDSQRQKDDLQRLEQELSRLKLSGQSMELLNPSNVLPRGISEGGETIAKLLHELEENLENSTEKVANCDRECMICMKDEVSVVFLPCAHQVLCANCSEDYGKKGKATCPCCRVPIEHRIRVFGASS